MIKFAIDDGIDPPPHPGGTRGNASRIRYMDEYSVETVGNSRVVKGEGEKKREEFQGEKEEGKQASVGATKKSCTPLKSVFTAS